MLCTKCGANVPEESEFCNKCGAKMKGVSVPDALSAPAGEKGGKEDKAKENKIWEGRFSAKAYAFWIGGLIVLAVIFLVSLITFWWNGVGGLKYIAVAYLAILLVLGVWLAVKVIVMKLGLKYWLSTQRIFVERGIISKRIDEIEMMRVDDVSVRQSIFQRMFDVGDVRVMSTDASDAALLIHGVAGPINVKEMIRQHTQKRRESVLNIERL